MNGYDMEPGAFANAYVFIVLVGSALGLILWAFDAWEQRQWRKRKERNPEE